GRTGRRQHMRRSTRVVVCATVAAVTVVAFGAATYAIGEEPEIRGTFVYATPSPTATSEGSGQPSATGEDGGPGPSPTKTEKKKASHGCPTGPMQRQVEQYLAAIGGFGSVTVDGEQSAEDCAAIK